MPQQGYESSASSNLARMNLTAQLCELLEPLFEHHDIPFMEYGQNVILDGNGSFLARLKKRDIKKSAVVCMTKFSPDYLLHNRSKERLVFLDAKSSITPMFFSSAIGRLQTAAGDTTLDRHRIGEIEREAWDNYRLRFPPDRVAICIAAPYNPNLVAVEWASRLQEFYRFRADVNVDAGGSQTPHVNLDFARMRHLNRFLADEFAVTVDPDMYTDLLEEIKLWPVNKPPRVNWTVFNRVVMEMHRECPWIRGRIPRSHSRRARIAHELESFGVEWDEF